MKRKLKYLLEALLPASVLESVKRRHYESEVRNSRLTDEPDLALLSSVVKPDYVCLDIGANVGVFTKHLSGMAKQVLAIEPFPTTFSYLSNNVKALALKNVSVFQTALSDRCGTVSMEPGRYRDGTPNNLYMTHITAHEGTIPSLTIDSLDLPRIDFVKLDVEGHERQVIAGAAQMISRSKPTWLIETDPDSELFGQLADLGYQCFVEDSGKLRPRSGREYKINYWFIHNSR